MEIISGIHQVDGVNANPYFIREETTAGRRWERSASDRMETIGASRWSDIVGEELVLVDAGMSKNPSKILTYLTGTLARRPSELKTIIITHAHPDHTGGLAAMVRATGAKVAIHEQDAPYLCGEKKMPLPKGGIGVMLRLLSPFMRPAPVKADIILHESDVIAGMKVIHIPGHTPGSIALLDEKRKVLFPGDTLRYRDGRIEGPPAKFTPDPELARRSIERLKRYDFDVMLAGHGEPLRGGASEKVRATAF